MRKNNFLKGLWEKTHVSTKLGIALTCAFIAFLVVLNTAIYGLANKFTWYFYSSTPYEHHISDATSQYLENAKGPDGFCKIIFCDNQESLESEVLYRLIWDTCNQYADKHDFITVETVNIYTNPEKVEPYKYEKDGTGNYVVNPETGKYNIINTISKTSVIFAGSKNFVVLSMQGFYTIDSNDNITAYIGEEIAAAMIYRALTDVHATAYFTVSHGETYSSAFYNRLLCSGYDLKLVDLMIEDLHNSGRDILIISNPRYDFVRGNPDKGIQAELDKMETFLSEGGTVYAMLDPLVTNTVYLEEMLTSWGIHVERSTSEENTIESVLVHDSVDSITTDGYALISSFSSNAFAQQIKEDMGKIGAGRVIVTQAAPLKLQNIPGKEVNALLQSSNNSKAYASGQVFDESGSFTVAATSKDTATGGEIFVIDSVYMTDQKAMTTNEYGNRDFVFFLFEYLSDADVPTGATYLIFEQTSLEGLTLGVARIWTIVLAVLIPLLVLGTGIVLVRRRRVA